MFTNTNSMLLLILSLATVSRVGGVHIPHYRDNSVKCPLGFAPLTVAAQFAFKLLDNVCVRDLHYILHCITHIISPYP